MPWERGRDEFLLSWVQRQGKGRWRWQYHSPASVDGEAEGGETTSLGDRGGGVGLNTGYGGADPRW